MRKKKLKKILLNIIFIMSMLCLCFVFTVSSKKGLTKRNYLAFSLIITLLFSIFITKKHELLKINKELTLTEKIISLVISIIYVIELGNNFDINNCSKIIFDIITKLNFNIFISNYINYFCIYAIYYIISYLIITFGRYIINFIKSLNKKENDYLKHTFLFFGILILIVYSNTNKFATMYDKMFSLDSGYVTGKMIKDIFWALDIRHILFAPLISPLTVIFNAFTKIFPNSANLYFILIALFNLFLLIIISIMIKRLSNNKWLPYIYMLSYPSILYAIVIEKYVFCIFFIILLLYEKYYTKTRNTEIEDASLIASVGTMSTSAVIGFIHGNGTLFNRIKKWVSLAIKFICISALFGKLNMIITIPNQLNTIFGKISNTPWQNKFYGVSELFYSFFFIPNYIFSNNTILFENSAKYLNYIGLLLFVLSITGFVIKNKVNYFKVSFYWFIFLLALFLGANWYCYEAPLFNLYFSWAIIPLVLNNIEIIKSKKIKQIIYITLISMMIIINIPELINIYKYVINI